MKRRREICLWRVFGCLVFAVACRANHSVRTVMLLKSGSTNNFDTMWNTDGAINDPHGNKSLIQFVDQLASSTDFKADIDQAWGDITELEIIGYNALGDELFYAEFDVAGKNISQVNSWFIGSDLVDTSFGISNPSTVVRDGDKELIIATNSNEAWFSILHPASGVDPKIVLAVNSSAALTVDSIGELDSLSPNAESVPLLTLTHTGGYIYIINVSVELFSRGWTDGFIYIDRISINATNSTGHAMLFSFEYLSNSIDKFSEYDDNGNHYFDTDGTPLDIHVLLVEGLRISYEWDVEQSTIELYGPTANSYVDVPMIAVLAHLGDSTHTVSTTDSGTTTNSGNSTTVGSGTTTDTVTTTDFPSTTTSSEVTSLYHVYPNLTVSVNGTLYCPCNQTSNISTTLNLTSIYQDSNKTFEELIADLTLDADTLSSNTRKYVSASDDRASAATLGTVGIVIIVSTVSFIVYMDSARLVQEASKIRKNYKILKKRLSKRSLRVETIKVECKEDQQDIPDILK
ncbi:uncharacterized protein LOC123537437 [Mercenaria mercenaria]|uniref:uncharacterized protein LOC123537437 n=1 Tax=Mercenaria mercenaria TaxID=6596 RepID=UPI00234F4EBD|nr:uncharacterized protein LOC123537437 [Mercenaria mercenaria]